LETKLFPTSTHHFNNKNTYNDNNTHDNGNHSHNHANTDPITSSSNILFELILKFCITCIEWTSRNDWTIVISKMGILTFKEMEDWELLLNDIKASIFKSSDHGSFITNVVLVCAHFNPRLQLLSLNSNDLSPSTPSGKLPLGF
jgi:Mediator complex subunit 13 C-terminal domain